MSPLSRRDFVQQGAAWIAGGAALGSVISRTAAAPLRGQDERPIRVAVIGCGGRGTGAAVNALQADPGVRIVALADAFTDRLEEARRRLARHDAARATVAERMCFAGLDAYREILDQEFEVVILATPPGFRPLHFAASVASGRHVFMEKPAAVCPAGVRQVLDAGRMADDRGLCVVAGTQRRHERSYREAIARLRDGAIGRPVAARCFWNMGGLWFVPADPARSDVENQLRNWLYHTWLSGDHIVEQHVHNIDVVNWAFDAHPLRACAVGGRQARTGPEFGHIYDHFAVDFEYPHGRFALSMARQQPGTSERVEEQIHGTEGVMRLAPGSAEVRGAQPWHFEGPNPNPYIVEMEDLLRAIRSGARINETKAIAESTLSAIMGRMAAYTGRDISWDEALKHELDLRPPPDLAFTSRPVDPVAIPGQRHRSA